MPQRVIQEEPHRGLTLNERFLLHLSAAMIVQHVTGLIPSGSAESEEYRAWRLALVRARLLIAAYFCVAGNVCFALLDLILYRQYLAQFLTLRAVMTLIAILGVLLNPFLSSDKKQGQMMFLLVWGECFPICAMTSVAEGFHSPYYSGIMLVIFGVAVLVPVRWRIHLTCQVGVLAVYWALNAAASWTHDDAVGAIGSSYFLFWTCALATASAVLYERLQKSEFRVQQELAASLQKVQVEKQRAELADVAKTKFLAAANHDLRQPLQALNWYLGGLEAHTDGGAREHAIAKLKASVESMNQLLTGLLDISRLDSGGIKPSIETVQITAVFERLRLEYAPVAESKGVAFHVVNGSSLVRSDPLLLEQLVSNLLSNAFRNTPSGWVELRAMELGSQLRISVRDCGVGIPEQYLEDIFVEFFQVGNQERDRSKGLGLGLAIVKRLSELLGYKIQVISTVGKGSEFSVDIPRVEDDVRNALEGPGKEPAYFEEELPPCYVAVVDDDREVREGVEFLLNQWGCMVVVATSGQDLFDKLADQDVLPDLLLTDYRLPGGETGMAVMAGMSERLRTRIPAIVITGDTSPDQLRELQRMGVPVLHKPVSPDALRHALSVLLREKAAQQISEHHH